MEEARVMVSACACGSHDGGGDDVCGCLLCDRDRGGCVAVASVSANVDGLRVVAWGNDEVM